MKKIVIIGAGASGYFLAGNLSNELFEIIILEKTSKVLSKVRISGGGRCNVTHDCYDKNELATNYPRGYRELKGVFSRFGVEDTVKWFESRGVKLKTEKDGRMFPQTNDSFSIVNCLIQEAYKNNVKLMLNSEVIDIRRQEDGFQLFLKNGGKIWTNYIVVSSGGNAKLAGYSFLKNLDIKINSPVPSLFTFNLMGNEIIQLKGISLPEARVKIVGSKLEETGPLLITHWGLSGPVVLKLSAWSARLLHECDYDFKISISWLGDINSNTIEAMFADKLSDSKRLVVASAINPIPLRLWKFLVNKAGIPDDMQWANVSKKKYTALKEILCNDIYHVKGKTTFKEEFVTCGGVDLKEVDLITMQSRKHPGLFFTGEVLDVDGITGGFNFQHAWSSAYIAANAINNNESVTKKI